jgi:hypothetical protein
MVLESPRRRRLRGTSLGSWIGALSDGTKTVWDAWGNDQNFAKVKFWTPKTA